MNTRKLAPMVVTVLAFGLLSTRSVEAQRPTNTQLQQALIGRMGPSAAIWRISTFRVQAIENRGSKVEPVWHARVRVVAKLTANTYLPSDFPAGVTVLSVQKRPGDSVVVYCRTVSTLYAGQWRTSVELEGAAFDDSSLGAPLSAFGGRVIITGSQEEVAFRAEQQAQLAEQQAQLRAQEQRAAETAAAASASQVATREIGRYRYLAAYGDQYLFAGHRPTILIPGTITLTDVGIALSGEKRGGTARPESHSFFDAFAARLEYYRSGGYSDAPATRILRANYVGLSDFRIVWDALGDEDRTPLVFDNRQDRDRFFADLTRAIQEWATRYPAVAAAQLNIEQRCLVNTYLVSCSESAPFVVR